MSYFRFPHCIALLAGAIALSAATAAMAGCQSGVVDGVYTSLLDGVECNGDAPGTAATAVGRDAKAHGFYSTAVGYNASALGHVSTVVGTSAGNGVTAIGVTAVGAFAAEQASGRYSTVLGAGNLNSGIPPAALGDYGIAIGGGDGQKPFGKPLNGARSTRFLSIALGTSSVANSDFAMAFGFNAKAGSGVVGPIGPIAIGPDAKATLTNATALGRFSSATAANTTALGSGSTASQTSSVALGSNSVANVANTVSVGNANLRRRIVNAAPGIANSDVPTLGQVKNIAATAAETASADLRQEVADLRALVKQQQQELAALKSQKAAALNQ
ncbi:MAG TPA: hypothetical protein VFK79_11820 [Xanthobacteraceae bacterium]|nr:hypothetical protein [Xanthobacteraceae bacterium]